MSDFGKIQAREAGLHKKLTAKQMSMIAIGGAIGTGLFLGSKFAISFAGPGVIVSYAIGGLIALFLMGCLAEMTIAHPTSGSFGRMPSITSVHWRVLSCATVIGPVLCWRWALR